MDRIMGYEDPAKKVAAFENSQQTCIDLKNASHLDLDVFIYHKGCNNYENIYKNFLVPAVTWYETKIKGQEVSYIMGTDIIAQLISVGVIEVKDRKTGENLAVCSLMEIPGSVNTLGLNCLFCNKDMYFTDWQSIMVEVVSSIANSLRGDYAGKSLLISEIEGCVNLDSLLNVLVDVGFHPELESYENQRCMSITL